MILIFVPQELSQVTLVCISLTYMYFSFQAGSVLIFVTKKANSEELASKLKTKDFEGRS